jgi:hypothetical protein
VDGRNKSGHDELMSHAFVRAICRSTMPNSDAILLLPPGGGRNFSHACSHSFPHPEVLGAPRRASKGEADAPGPASFEARAARGHLRMRWTLFVAIPTAAAAGIR